MGHNSPFIAKNDGIFAYSPTIHQLIKKSSPSSQVPWNDKGPASQAATEATVRPRLVAPLCHGPHGHGPHGISMATWWPSYVYICVCVCAPILNHGFSFRGISGNLRWLWKIMCSIGKSSINGPCSIARSNNQRAFDVSGDGFRKLWPVNGHDYRQVDVWSLLFKVSKALPLVNNRE